MAKHKAGNIARVVGGDLQALVTASKLLNTVDPTLLGLVYLLGTVSGSDDEFYDGLIEMLEEEEGGLLVEAAVATLCIPLNSKTFIPLASGIQTVLEEDTRIKCAYSVGGEKKVKDLLGGFLLRIPLSVHISQMYSLRISDTHEGLGGVPRTSSVTAGEDTSRIVKILHEGGEITDLDIPQFESMRESVEDASDRSTFYSCVLGNASQYLIECSKGPEAAIRYISSKSGLDKDDVMSEGAPLTKADLLSIFDAIDNDR